MQQITAFNGGLQITFTPNKWWPRLTFQKPLDISSVNLDKAIWPKWRATQNHRQRMKLLWYRVSLYIFIVFFCYAIAWDILIGNSSYHITLNPLYHDSVYHKIRCMQQKRRKTVNVLHNDIYWVGVFEVDAILRLEGFVYEGI